jgi:zinc protease
MSRFGPALLALSVLIACVITQPGLAQSDLPRPEMGEPIPFDLLPTNSVMLDNGLVVTFIPWGMTPTATIIVNVRAGNIDDGMDTWLADTTVALMEEGAAGRDRGEIATLFGAMGSSLFTRVTETHSSFSTFVLADRGTEAIRLLADAVRRPDFPSEPYSRVQQSILHRTEGYQSQPGFLALEAVHKHLYPEAHPFHRTFPTEEQINSYSISDLRRFYRSNFGARRTHIYIAGRFDQATMEAAVREHFDDWAMGPADDAPDAISTPEPYVHLIDRPGAPQSTIRLVYPVSAIDGKHAPALEVFNNAMNAAISAQHREAGYSYSPTTYINWTRGGGNWTYSDDVNSPMTSAALTNVFSILRWQRDTSWDTSETKTWMANYYVMSTSSTDGLLGQTMLRDSFSLPFDYLNTYVTRILRVPDRSLTAMARSYLREDRLTLVIVGDLDVIEADIRALPELQGIEFQVTSERR